MAAPTAPITPKGGVNHIQVEHLSVADEAFGSSWDGSLKVPSKNAVYDAIAALNISSGTYTPTTVNTTNVSSSSAVASYARVGNTVTVWGYLSIDAIAAGPITIDVSLPVTASFAVLADLIGVASCDTVNASLAIYTNAVDGKARFTGTPPTTSAIGYTFTFSYRAGASLTPLPIASVSDSAFSSAWDAIANIAPSQNAIFDALGGGAITAGTYTPTMTNVANAPSPTANLSFYVRVAGICLVFGLTGVSATTGTPAATVGISLPPAVPSNFTAAGNCIGLAASYNPSSIALIGEDIANDRALIQWAARPTAAMGSINYFFGYRVL